MSPLPDPATPDGMAALNAIMDTAADAAVEVMRAARGADMVTITYRPCAVSPEGHVAWAIDTTAPDMETLLAVLQSIALAVAGGLTLDRVTLDDTRGGGDTNV